MVAIDSNVNKSWVAKQILSVRSWLEQRRQTAMWTSVEKALRNGKQIAVQLSDGKALQVKGVVDGPTGRQFKLHNGSLLPLGQAKRVGAPDALYGA